LLCPVFIQTAPDACPNNVLTEASFNDIWDVLEKPNSVLMQEKEMAPEAGKVI
jgi:hypothetical protein